MRKHEGGLSEISVQHPGTHQQSHLLDLRCYPFLFLNRTARETVVKESPESLVCYELNIVKGVIAAAELTEHTD